MPQRMSRRGQYRENSLPQLYHGIMPRLRSRKKIPSTIRTTGPANERGWRGGMTGGGGGGACSVLAIFHLTVELSRRLRRSRSCCRDWRWLRRWRSAQVAAFHQLENSENKQDEWPCTLPIRPMQIVYKEDQA